MAMKINFKSILLVVSIIPIIANAQAPDITPPEFSSPPIEPVYSAKNSTEIKPIGDLNPSINSRVMEGAGENTFLKEETRRPTKNCPPADLSCRLRGIRPPDEKLF